MSTIMCSVTITIRIDRVSCGTTKATKKCCILLQVSTITFVFLLIWQFVLFNSIDTEVNFPISSEKSTEKNNLTGAKFLCVVKNNFPQIQQTWGKYCSQIVNIPNTNAVVISKRLKNLVASTYDWMLVVEGKTYVIFKNLVAALRKYDKNELIVIGRNYKGLLLSSAATKRIFTSPNDLKLINDIFNTSKLNHDKMKEHGINYFRTLMDGSDKDMIMPDCKVKKQDSIFNVKTQIILMRRGVNEITKTPAIIPDSTNTSITVLHYLAEVLKIPNNAMKNEQGSLIANHGYLTPNNLNSIYLANKVRILCLILTEPSKHKTRSRHIKATWGKRCNRLIFLSSQEDPELATLVLPKLIEGYDHLWQKVQAGMKYIYKNHIIRTDEEDSPIDWILKADDDTFIIMDNLRTFLHGQDPNKPSYFGMRMRGQYRHPWVSGGAGYVLSKDALKLFVEKALGKDIKAKATDSDLCPFRIVGLPEDALMGLCLHRVNATCERTTDEYNRQRFLPYSISTAVNGQLLDAFYLDYAYDFIPRNVNCCSDTAISFHYTKPYQLYELEYFTMRFTMSK